MTRLSVNINKIALLRNSRQGNYPNILDYAKKCLRLGAQSITIHPRPDQRHIKHQDIQPLRRLTRSQNTELNIEGNPLLESFDSNLLHLILSSQPDQCTLVPDSPESLTSDQGFSIKNMQALAPVTQKLRDRGIKISIFVGPNIEDIKAAADIGAQAIELYTGPYAKDPKATIKTYQKAAQVAEELKLQIHAGHDLNLKNITLLKKEIPNLYEVSIGHALTIESLYRGLDKTIKKYLAILQK